MDKIDYAILDILQNNSSTPLGEISERVGLTVTPCWKRIRKLEASGAIVKRVAVLSREKLGFGLTALVFVVSALDAEEELNAYARNVALMPEVVAFYKGQARGSFVLRIESEDMETYGRTYSRLLALAPVRSAVTRFVVGRIKATTALPLSQAPANAEAEENLADRDVVGEARRLADAR